LSGAGDRHRQRVRARHSKAQHSVPTWGTCYGNTCHDNSTLHAGSHTLICTILSVLLQAGTLPAPPASSTCQHQNGVFSAQLDAVPLSPLDAAGHAWLDVTACPPHA
jgi:hypothetical protein